MSKAKRAIEQLLQPLDITINGSRAWDIQVHNDKLYQRLLFGGSLALGESYMQGWWDADAVDVLFEKLLNHRLDKALSKKLPLLLLSFSSRIINPQTRRRSYKVGKQHYDIGNDLFTRMLDKRMNYSCAYWQNATNLDEAQEAKLDLVCRKLRLKAGMRVLDIGCGWGSFAQYAAEKYGVSVYGVTVSQEQAKFARQRCEGLDVTIDLNDYRAINQIFDAVVSIGMFEHVGYKNYPTYMAVVERCLKDDGLFLLHTIGGNYSVVNTDPWIERYIFPNSMLPSGEQIMKASQELFVLEHWHNFGQYYDHTLMAWHQNFVNSWHEIKANYDEVFYRMWCYYLLSCAGAFRVRNIQLWQFVFSKHGLQGGYVFDD